MNPADLTRGELREKRAALHAEIEARRNLINRLRREQNEAMRLLAAVTREIQIPGGSRPGDA